MANKKERVDYTTARVDLPTHEKLIIIQYELSKKSIGTVTLTDVIKEITNEKFNRMKL